MNKDLLWAALKLHSSDAFECGHDSFFMFDLGNGDTPNFAKPNHESDDYRIEAIIADALRELSKDERDEILKSAFADQYQELEESKMYAGEEKRRLDSICHHDVECDQRSAFRKDFSL